MLHFCNRREAIDRISKEWQPFALTVMNLAAE